MLEGGECFLLTSPATHLLPLPAFLSLALTEHLAAVCGAQCLKSSTRMSATSNFFEEVTEILVMWFGSANDSLYRIVLSLHGALPSRLCVYVVVLQWPYRKISRNTSFKSANFLVSARQPPCWQRVTAVLRVLFQIIYRIRQCLSPCSRDNNFSDILRRVAPISCLKSCNSR